MIYWIDEFLKSAVGIVWGIPTVVLLASTGFLLTLLLKGIQFRAFKHAIQVVMGKFKSADDPGQLSHFQSLCTALSATVGLGNIAGVAVAIKLGGPGATFWLIVTGVLGMATKFAECTLSLKYREIDPKTGAVRGGPMYTMVHGLGKRFKPMAVFFAVCCLVATFGGANMFQTNQIAAIWHEGFGVPPIWTGILLAVSTGLVIVGGIQRIGKVTELLVPFMALIYVGASLFALMKNFEQIPHLFAIILDGAFNGHAAVGGFAGVMFKEVLLNGVRRASFSNEAGLGSSPIAHSVAATKEPVREGIVALLEPFVDTVVICTMTALVVVSSGAWLEPDANGVVITARAFNAVIPGFGTYFVPIAVLLFGYSTLISWSFYGEKATEFLFKGKGILIYKIAFCIVGFFGAIWTVESVLNFSDVLYALMIVPNLISVWLLFPVLKKETDRYFKLYIHSKK